MSAVTVVVGNPKAASRTRTVAEAVARRVAPGTRVEVVELADLGPELFDWSSGRVRDAVEGVLASSVVVVASPVFKASFTGLLKSFLDWFPADSLSDVLAVPVMVGAGDAHALAVETHLRPVLVELGAAVPTSGVFLREDRLDRLEDELDGWWAVAGRQLAAVVDRPRPVS